MLRIDDDAVFVIDGAPVPRLRRTKLKILHGFHEFATVARILDRGTHLNPCHTPVRPNPEPDLVPPFISGRRPRGDIWYQARRGPENITRAATRARTGIGAGPGPAARPCPGPPVVPSPVPTTAMGWGGGVTTSVGTGMLIFTGCVTGATVGTVTAAGGRTFSARAAAGAGGGRANQLTAGRPPPPPPPRGPVPPPPPLSNSAAPRHNTRMAMATCARSERAAAGPSRRWGRGSE